MANLAGITLIESRAPGVRDLVAEIGLNRAADEHSTGCRDLTIHLQRAEPETLRDPLLEGYRPTFFQGIVQAYREPLGHAPRTLLWDKKSRFFVSEAESRIDGFVADDDVVRGSAHAALEIALALLLCRLGRFHLHAAAVVEPEGEPVLIVGGSGAGKTTTTLALIESGWAFLSDDALLLARSPEGPEIFAFPRHFHVGEKTLAAFPRLRALTVDAPGYGEKRDLDPTIAFPGLSRARCGTPKRVLYPRIEGEKTTSLAPLEKAESLGNLIAASASLVIEGVPQKEAHLALLSHMASAAEHQELRLGEDLLADPALLTRLLRQT